MEGLSTARKMARFGVGGDFEALGAALVRTLLIGFGAQMRGYLRGSAGKC